MKALFIRRLHLWPRFEASVKEVLDAVDKEIEVFFSAVYAIWIHKSLAAECDWHATFSSKRRRIFPTTASVNVTYGGAK